MLQQSPNGPEDLNLVELAKGEDQLIFETIGEFDTFIKATPQGDEQLID